MSIKTAKEVFVLLLSSLRENAKWSKELFREVSQISLNPELNELLEARVFLSDQVLATLDECFNLIGEKPVELSGNLFNIFVTDFRRQLAVIDSPVARQLYVLAKATHWVHLMIAEYVALVAAANVTGHPGVSALLESALADKLTFVKQTRRLIRKVVETKMAAKMAA